MSKQNDLQTGDKVQLRGPNDIPLPDLYEFLDSPQEDGKINKHIIRVKGPNEIPMRVHRSRINRVIKQEGQTEIIQRPLMEESAMPEQETAEVATQTQAKKRNIPELFNLKEWLVENGGIHMEKTSKFDHTNYKLVSHVCIDIEKKFYNTINTYTYPNGTISLGKKGTGGNKYPLKGKVLAVTYRNQEGDKEKKVLKGKKTYQQVIEQFKKKGYILKSELPKESKESKD